MIFSVSLPLQKKLLLAFCVFLGLALQIQNSFNIWGDYKAIRLALADMILPAAGLLVAVSLLRRKSSWPRLRLRLGLLWPCLLSAIMVFALWNGYYQSGALSPWALYNKFFGWLALMAYFLLGAWLGTNKDEALLPFLRALVITFIFIAAGNLAYFIARDLSMPVFTNNNAIPLEGGMGNRNAFAFLTTIVLSVLLVFKKTGKVLIPHSLEKAFYVLLPVIMVYNGSRAGGMIIIVMLLAGGVLYGRIFLRPILLPLLAGTAIVFVIFTLNPAMVLRENQNITAKYLVAAAQNGELNYKTYQEVTPLRTSDMMRLRFLHDSIILWKSAPLEGIGLGSFLRFQVTHYPDKDINLFIIDCTPLWILVETGLIGLVVFVAFALFSAGALWRGSRVIQDDGDRLRLAMLLIGLSFTAMGLFHELLYTRVLWFMLGLALAVPAPARKVDA